MPAGETLMRGVRSVMLAAAASLALIAPGLAAPDGMETIGTRYDFDKLKERVEAAIQSNQMLLVGKASASAGAEARGIHIPGDAVFLVFRNDFAVRMLAADPNTGIEAPIPIHVFQRPDGTAAVAWRHPSAIFAAWHNDALNKMSAELDAIFAKIARDAAVAER
jgi:uncharacterized protein (DUF302 family)